MTTTATTGHHTKYGDRVLLPHCLQEVTGYGGNWHESGESQTGGGVLRRRLAWMWLDQAASMGCSIVRTAREERPHKPSPRMAASGGVCLTSTLSMHRVVTKFNCCRRTALSMAHSFHLANFHLRLVAVVMRCTVEEVRWYIRPCRFSTPHLPERICPIKSLTVTLVARLPPVLTLMKRYIRLHLGEFFMCSARIPAV